MNTSPTPLSSDLSLLTRQQAARFLGVHPNTLDLLRRRGEIAVTSLGKRCPRFSSESLRAYVESRTKKV